MLRLEDDRSRAAAERLTAVFQAEAGEAWAECLVVVTDHKVRGATPPAAPNLNRAAASLPVADQLEGGLVEPLGRGCGSRRAILGAEGDAASSAGGAAFGPRCAWPPLGPAL